MLTFIGAMVLIILSPIINGWVLSILWGWFILPTFPSAPVLNIPQAMGLSLTFSFLVSHLKHDEETTKESNPVKALVYGFIKTVSIAIVFLAIGYKVHLFI